MDLNVTLTERERTILLAALFFWEGDGCPQSPFEDLACTDFHGLLDNLKADRSQDQRFFYKGNRRPDETECPNCGGTIIPQTTEISHEPDCPIVVIGPIGIESP